MSKKIELVTIVEQKEFTNKGGESIKYFDIRLKLNNRTFLVRPLEKDKKFFNYLLSEIYAVEE